MKRVLFLSYNYPYGLFGPSTLCSSRIMEELCKTEEYEVHNISYKANGQAVYQLLDKVTLHFLPYPKKKDKKRKYLYLNALLSLPTYPFAHPCSNRRFYRECQHLINGKQFDLVVAQCFPEECVWAGTKLKEDGLATRLMVIFWDNIYGRMPRRFIPKCFAIRKQRQAESWIARNADSLVSLYPIKGFHQQYGDVPEAKNKRSYLGLPSLARPSVFQESAYQHVVKEGFINILFSGSIFKSEHVFSLVNLLNELSIAHQINLIFFAKGVIETVFTRLRDIFKGRIENSGWIPHDDLLALFPSVDFFLSFPGIPTAIRSKVFEYMSYGKPLLLMYDDEQDVNVSAFSKYPACLAVDVRKPVIESIASLECFFNSNYGKVVPFEETERLFESDTARAYIDLISRILNDKSDNN